MAVIYCALCTSALKYFVFFNELIHSLGNDKVIHISYQKVNRTSNPSLWQSYNESILVYLCQNSNIIPVNITDKCVNQPHAGITEKRNRK
jgi:hypothetical protein